MTKKTPIIISVAIMMTAVAFIYNTLGISSNRIFVVGDSMVAGVNIDLTTKSVIQAYSWSNDFPDADIDGKSGAALEVLLTEFMPAEPYTKAVVIFAGFNNIKRRHETPEAIATKYSDLIHRAKLFSDNVLCIAIPPINHEKSIFWYPEGYWISNNRIHTVNQHIKAICGAGFVDTESFWAISDSDDGIHPNRLGHEKIVSEVRRKLGKHILAQIWTLI